MELERFGPLLVVLCVMAFVTHDASSGDCLAEEVACLQQDVTGMKHVNNYT
jgi:hypothetical protein